ncbi:MAG: methylmalonyl-CoA mutase, partial [Bacteroidota bacterium]|nr:methylmalonyl-CoA mutase [Bacteroidota bacterium]
NLTDEVEKKAWELIEKIDAMGGSVSAIEAGYMQDEIARSAYAYQRNIESGDKIIVGVNRYQVEKETPIPGFRIDDQIRVLQTQKLQALKTRRNPEQVSRCLEGIAKAAQNGDNLMPAVIEAAEQLCTLGEMSDVLRKVFGEYAS